VLAISPSQTNVSCFIGNNGTATATVSGGTANYTYAWSNGQSTSSISNLLAGNYSVSVTDGKGCTVTNTFTITQPISPLSSLPSHTNVSCFSGNNGAASVSVSGGTVNYTYSWSNGQSTSSISNLTAGNYSVTITDSKGCTTANTFSVTQPAVLISSPSQINVSCFGGNNGTATATVSGGTASYTYAWSNGQSTSSVSNLIAGNYSVAVTDSKGCTAASSFTVAQPALLSSTSSQINVSCSGGNNGSSTVSVSGGTLAYSYLWNNGQTTSSATGLSAGNYSVTVTDSKGCTTAQSFVISEPSPLLSNASQTNICSGAINGGASVTVSGGSPAYTYLWSSGQTTSAVTGLSAGSYSVNVKDANNCNTSASVTVAIFPALVSAQSQSNVSCFGGNNGLTTVNVSGGDSPYSYLWNNGQSSSAAMSLISGNYSVTITDANGCTITKSFSITQPAVLGSTTSSTPDTCGHLLGTVTVIPNGGTVPYS
ncbi:MAG TPA: SprB repeat-containing protein, partial [Bacteroidia bacterium]